MVTMTMEVPPSLSQASGWPVSQCPGPWSSGTGGGHRLTGLPEIIDGWSLTPFAAGLWLSAGAAAIPADVLALAAEPGRASVVIDADGPDPRTDRLLWRLFPVLSMAGLGTLRLLLSTAADRYAAASCAFDLDLIAAEATVTITPYGYAIVRLTGPASRAVMPQWRRSLPAGQTELAGALSPSPAWEVALASGLVTALGQPGTVRRVPAGLALQQPGADAGSARAADAVWPDPERVTVVVGAVGLHDHLHETLATLLPRLPLRDTDGVRLYWSRAGTGAAALRELAARCGTDLIASAADVRPSGGFGGMCHGPGGAAPWLRFSRAGSVSVMGSLYPTPAWQRALGDANLGGLVAGMAVEQVAAGLCVRRPGSSGRGLVETARSVLPDPWQMTVVVGGDVHDDDVRQGLEAVLDELPTTATRSVRLVLAAAGAGGRDSYAQHLADTLGSELIAPAGGWTATPDGRLRILGGPGASEPGAGGWCRFSPRPVAGARRYPGQGAAVAVSSPQQDRLPPAQPVPLDQADPRSLPGLPGLGVLPDLPGLGVLSDAPDLSGPRESKVTEPPGNPGRIIRLPRDHRSSDEERRLYRESATRYQIHAVAVRRIVTQRPGLRIVAAGEAEDALVTDFTAVLDLLDDDHAGAAALRSAGPASDPRVACALSGLRRLPSFTGPVFSTASLPGPAASGYTAGQTLVEPAFVRATSSSLVVLQGGIEYVIWSQMGKRAAVLAAKADSDEILFAAGTAYRVLRVNAAQPGSGRARVFLRELTSSRRGESTGPAQADQLVTQPDEMDHRMLERLSAAAAQLDDAAASGQVLSRQVGGVAPPIGLDAHGIPFSA
jgi:hypothetical protein